MSDEQQLSDGWKVQDYAPGEGLAIGVHQPSHADGDWLGIPVPGDVHRALISAGRIPDPYYDRNESACAWMEEREWWYRLTFAFSLAIHCPSESSCWRSWRGVRAAAGKGVVVGPGAPCPTCPPKTPLELWAEVDYLQWWYRGGSSFPLVTAVFISAA